MVTGPPLILTDRERFVFDQLLALNCAHNCGTTFRVAGGWVRDKLLGNDSHDIDIALDNMTGEEFCRKVKLRSSVIASNPDQSKHLETAIVSIGGQTVELVNLRDESWAGAYDGSRILTENRFGTPEVDAQRRDLTINGLFYNLNTGRVEDYVGGLEDLGYFHTGGYGRWERTNDMIRLRTPLPARQTFLDDPLRLLRAYRFLGKLGYTYLDQDLANAARDPEVHAAFAARISQERVAAELLGKREAEGGFKSGILSNSKAAWVLDVMSEAGLLDLILNVKEMEGFRPFKMDQNSFHHKFDVFTHTLELMDELWGHPHFQSLDNHRQTLLMFAALLHDVGKRDPACTQRREDGFSSYKGHEDSSANVARALCNKLKLSDDDKHYVINVVQAHMLPHGQGWGNARTLRRFKHKYTEWQDIIAHAHCDVLATGFERGDEIAHYEDLLARGRELDVLEQNAPPTDKPIINGMKVMELIPELPPKCGFIRDVNASLLEMRFDNPETTEEKYLGKIIEMKPSLLEKYASFVKES